MRDKELLEMICILLDMDSETYEKCKYMILDQEKQSKSEIVIFKTLFRLVDKYRPMLLQMK